MSSTRVQYWIGRNTTSRDAFYAIAVVWEDAKPVGKCHVFKQWGKGSYKPTAGQVNELTRSFASARDEFQNTVAEKLGKGYEEVAYDDNVLVTRKSTLRDTMAEAVLATAPHAVGSSATTAPVKWDPVDDAEPEWVADDEAPTMHPMADAEARKKAQLQMATSFGTVVGNMRQGMDLMLQLAGATAFGDLGEITQTYQMMKRALADVGSHMEEMEAYTETYADILAAKLEDV